MKTGFRFATLCLFVSFAAMAKDAIHIKPLTWHGSGYLSQSGSADTAETPDEHIAEDINRPSRSAAWSQTASRRSFYGLNNEQGYPEFF